MKNKAGYLVLGIIAAIFTLVTFTFPFVKTPAFWISYSFGLVAISFQTPLWRRAFEGGNLKNRFLDYPSLVIGITYLVIQILVSLVIMASKQTPSWAALFASAILLAIASILVLSGNVAKRTFVATDKQVQRKTSFIRGLKTDVDSLRLIEKDPEVKRGLEELADAIRFSDPVSHEDLVEIELQLSEKVSALSSACDNKVDLISEIMGLLQQRNALCKSLKGTRR